MFSKKRWSLALLCLVLLPAGRSAYGQAASAPVESELGVSGLGSVGHFHVYTSSWWSYLDLASVEYDRHSWGNALRAELNYTSAYTPVVLLRQPKSADVWGNPTTTQHEMVYGIGAAPLGIRMIWLKGKSVRPYFLSRGGVMMFDKKAFSPNAAYFNFSLEIGTGAQFRITPRWSGRAGFSYYHISNAFIVPSNPGLDSMMYTVGVCYRLKGKR